MRQAVNGAGRQGLRIRSTGLATRWVDRTWEKQESKMIRFPDCTRWQMMGPLYEAGRTADEGSGVWFRASRSRCSWEAQVETARGPRCKRRQEPRGYSQDRTSKHGNHWEMGECQRTKDIAFYRTPEILPTSSFNFVLFFAKQN